MYNLCLQHSPRKFLHSRFQKLYAACLGTIITAKFRKEKNYLCVCVYTVARVLSCPLPGTGLKTQWVHQHFHVILCFHSHSCPIPWKGKESFIWELNLKLCGPFWKPHLHSKCGYSPEWDAPFKCHMGKPGLATMSAKPPLLVFSPRCLYRLKWELS
jgi:hypothetical protein